MIPNRNRKIYRFKEFTFKVKGLKTACIFLLVFLLQGNISSQAKFTIVISNNSGKLIPDSAITLKAYYLDKLKKVDFLAKKINAKGTLLQVNEAEPGVYNLNLPYGINFDIVLNKKTEDTILIKIAESSIGISSTEQQAFDIFKEISTQKAVAAEKFDENRMVVSSVDPYYIRKKEAVKHQGDSAREVYNKVMKARLGTYRNTYTYNYLRPLVSMYTRFGYPNGYEMYDHSRSFYYAHTFDSIPLEDELIAHNPLFKEVLNKYLNNYFGEFTEDYRTATYALADRCKEPALREYILNRIILYLYTKNEYGLIKELFEKYYDGCFDNIDNRTIKDILESPLVVNSKMDDFILFGQSNQQPAALSSVLQQKPNLIIFWREDCSHCLETLSIMNAQVSKYAKYHIITVQLSEQKLAKDVPLSKQWTNLYCGSSVGDILTILKIRRTPFIIETDKELRISQIYTSYESIKF